MRFQTLEPEEIRRHAMNDGILTVVYKDGDGRLNLNLPALMPCKAGDLKRVFAFFDLAYKPEEYAQILCDYIAAQVAPLQEERKGLHANTKRAKEIDKILKAYAANIAGICKAYPNITATVDAPETIRLKKAEVYSLHTESDGVPFISVHEGWTFEKNGHVFDMYQMRQKYYVVLLHGTGGQVHSGETKDEAKNVPARVFDAIEKNAEKIDEYKKTFELHFHAAMEEAMMKKIDYYNNAVTVDGVTYPAEYNMFGEKVLCFTTIGKRDNGRLIKHKTVIGPEHAYFDEALAAARGNAGNAPEEAAPEPANADPEPVKPAAPEARGPVKEKTFIGTEITGHGWKILFDGETARTRIIFEAEPIDAAKKAIEEARFFWSPNMQSYNKKLTFKAYRAAVKLANTLNEIYAA